VELELPGQNGGDGDLVKEAYQKDFCFDSIQKEWNVRIFMEMRKGRKKKKDELPELERIELSRKPIRDILFAKKERKKMINTTFLGDDANSV